MIIWKLVTCQRITSKRYSSSMSRHLSPRYGQVILVSGYPVLTAVNWSQHWCAICVQYQSSCAPKLARKCEIGHWLPCGAGGRTVSRAGGRAVYGHLMTKFSRMGSLLHFLTHGAPLRPLRARELCYKFVCSWSLNLQGVMEKTTWAWLERGDQFQENILYASW